MGLTVAKLGKMGSSGVQRGQWVGFSGRLGDEGLIWEWYVSRCFGIFISFVPAKLYAQ